MANVKARLVQIKSTQKIPLRIVNRILAEIGHMLDFNGRYLANNREHFDGALIRDDGVYCATIKTWLHRSKKRHGLLFHAMIMLHHVRRRIGKLIASIPIELIDATFVVKPLHSGNPAHN